MRKKTAGEGKMSREAICSRCGYDKGDPSRVECPRCGLVSLTSLEGGSGVPKEKTEAAPSPPAKVPITLKSKLFVLFVTAVSIFLFVLPWWYYVHEKTLELTGESAWTRVAAVQEMAAGRGAKTFAFYAFVTRRGVVVRAKYPTDKLRRGDPVEVFYDPRNPEDNFPRQGRRELLYTLLFSMLGPGVYFGSMCCNYPNFREYVKDKLGLGRN